MAHILLVRHGETDWNKAQRLQGHLDIDLNEQGKIQAQLLGKALANEKIDIAYSSDLSRALKTANTITAHHDIPTFIDIQLRERCYGEIQGLTYQEIEEKLPDNIVHPDLVKEEYDDVFEEEVNLDEIETNPTVLLRLSETERETLLENIYNMAKKRIENEHPGNTNEELIFKEADRLLKIYMIDS